jgi:hypothetical protein
MNRDQIITQIIEKNRIFGHLTATGAERAVKEFARTEMENFFSWMGLTGTFMDRYNRFLEDTYSIKSEVCDK